MTAKEVIIEYLKWKINVPFDDYDIEREIQEFVIRFENRYFTTATYLKLKRVVVAEMLGGLNTIPNYTLKEVDYKIKGSQQVPAKYKTWLIELIEEPELIL